MAKSLQESSLATSLDKISYITAGVLGLLILGLSLTGGKTLTGLQGSIGELMDNVQRRRDERIVLAPVPSIERDLQAQWTVPKPDDYAEWTTERVPSLLQGTADVLGPKVIHQPAKFTQISYHRDKKTYAVYLKIEGVLGETEHARFDRAKLFRSVDGGAFEEVRGFKGSAATASGAVSYEDRAVEYGKTYSYTVRTKVSKRPGAGVDVVLAPDDVEKESAECAITAPIPGDVWVRLAFAEGYNADLDKSGFMQGQIFIGSTEAGADPIQITSKTAGGRFDEDFAFGPLVTNRSGKRVKLFKIQSTEDNKVNIRNQLKRGKDRDMEFSRDSDKIPLVLPEPVNCEPVESAEPEGGVGEEPVGDDPSAEPDAAEPAPPAEPEGEAKEPEGEKKGGGVFK